MDLKHLSHFVALAEEMNVVRTAEKLGIAQSALSLQIQQLEHSVGGPLFERRNRRLTLAPEGAVFLEEARLILHQAELSVREVQRMGRGELGQIKLSYVDSAMLGEQVPAALMNFKRQYPDVDLQLTGMNVRDQISSLLDEALDAAIVRGPLPPLPHLISGYEFGREELLACLPNGHSLQCHRTLQVSMLVSEDFITPNDSDEAGLAGQTLQICRRAGFHPKISQCTERTVAIAALVAAGFGIALLPASLTHLESPDLIFRKFNPQLWSNLYLLSKTSERRPVTVAFLKCWRSCLPNNVVEFADRLKVDG